MKQINAMMAGTVVEILVAKGDQITDGQDVVILESMKMQLPIAAEVSGLVSEIKVAAGDFVNEGDVLMVLS
ncbi:MAG: acetyl-CoA carboxylase biotin carboxyl carrier protein subunit [Candidatus Obscuribacterales bacterium]|nr:acetyl-CoA carboxylase biotin carboxyl carrier protein subunit [Candidatus Obscuribacterales bacterium]